MTVSDQFARATSLPAGASDVTSRIVSAGYLGQMLQLVRPYQPRVDWRRVTENMDRISGEYRDWGINCPDRTIKDMVLMRAITLPTHDEQLALALDRYHVHTAFVDDVTEYRTDLRELRSLFADLADPSTAHRSAFSGYLAHVFRTLHQRCPEDFVGAFAALHYNSVLGVLMETQFSTDGLDLVDTDWVVARCGFAEPWFAMLACMDASLDFYQNLSFYAAALPLSITFLRDFNDLASFYKELHNGDFEHSRIRRAAVRAGEPYELVYEQTLRRGTAAYLRILELSNPRQRPIVENYLKGYIYWHAHSERYGWSELVPGLHPYSIGHAPRIGE